MQAVGIWGGDSINGMNSEAYGARRSANQNMITTGIPEPASLVMLVMGLIGLAAIHQR